MSVSAISNRNRKNTRPNLHIEQSQKSTQVALNILHLASLCSKTPANLSLGYLPGSRIKGIVGRVSWNYV